MLPRPIALVPACLALLAACEHDDDRVAELEEFRSEIGEAGLSRIAIARMYQRGKWIVGAVAEDAPAAQKIAHVCAALTPLTPTYVSGLVRLDYDDKVTQEMIDVFTGVKECVRQDALEKNTGRKVRFDVVLNAKHYTEQNDFGIDTKKEGLDRLKARLIGANKLDPDGYLFDFFSDPWTSKESVFHTDALAEGIAFIQKQGRFVGGNTGGFAPPGADFVAITDRGGFENVKETVDRLADWPHIPVLLHIRNDPHCVGSEGRLYVEGDRAYRKQRLRRHVRWTDRLDLTYMFPALFPLYPTPPHVDACDHGKTDDPDPAHIGEVFDALLDGNLLDRMVEYIGPPPKKGQPVVKSKISDEDALPSEYDLADEGLVAVHLATDGDTGGHHYSTSLYELEEVEGLALDAEDYFSLARDPAPGTIALHRCDRADNGAFLSTDSECEGLGVDGGILGHVGAAQLDGTVPLYRLSRGAPADALYTTSALERDAAVAAGYAYVGVVAFVWDELGYAVPDLPDPPAPPPDPLTPCADPVRPIYRGYVPARRQHLFAVNHDEILVPGMNDEGVPFQLKPGAPTDGWSPFYRCFRPGFWHLLTTDPNCEGAPSTIREGSLGNIARDPLPGTLPLYRYFHADPQGINDHLFVVGTGCVSIPGYVCKGVVGHVCPRP